MESTSYSLTIFIPILFKINHCKDYEKLLFSGLEVTSTASAGLKTVSVHWGSDPQPHYVGIAQ